MLAVVIWPALWEPTQRDVPCGPIRGIRDKVLTAGPLLCPGVSRGPQDRHTQPLAGPQGQLDV